MQQSLAEIRLRNGAFIYTRRTTDKPHNSQHHTYMLNCYQLFYLVSGNVEYQVEGACYPLNPGDLIILNKKELHRPYFASEDSYERVLLFFRPEFCVHYCDEQYDLLRYFERKKPGSFNRLPGELVMAEGLHRYFEEMEAHERSGLPERGLLIELTFVRLLVHLNQLVSAYPGSIDFRYDTHEKLDLIMTFVHDNLHRNVPLDEIESRFHINKYYFSHLFKKATGSSFKKYVTMKRLAKAAELLKLSVAPSEAARRAGFEDYSNFYKAFTGMMGVPPSKYK